MRSLIFIWSLLICQYSLGEDCIYVDSAGSDDIDLLDLSIVSTPIAVHLKWEVDYEIDGAYFVVEKSLDGITWNEKSRRESVGNHDTYKTYLESITNFPEAAVEFFRLKRIDKYGNEQVLDVTTVTHEILSDIKVYKDETGSVNSVTVSFESLAAGKGLVSIFDSNGKVQGYKSQSIDLGYNRRVINTGKLEAGTYLVVVEDQLGNKVSKRWIIYSKKKRRRK